MNNEVMMERNVFAGRSIYWKFQIQPDIERSYFHYNF
jgi:hypothetical protein